MAPLGEDQYILQLICDFSCLGKKCELGAVRQRGREQGLGALSFFAFFSLSNLAPFQRHVFWQLRHSALAPSFSQRLQIRVDSHRKCQMHPHPSGLRTLCFQWATPCRHASRHIWLSALDRKHCLGSASILAYAPSRSCRHRTFS